ncbi:MAG: hypothetical protein ACK5MG_03070 [Bacteroidales bacterium]
MVRATIIYGNSSKEYLYENIAGDTTRARNIAAPPSVGTLRVFTFLSPGSSYKCFSRAIANILGML